MVLTNFDKKIRKWSFDRRENKTKKNKKSTVPKRLFQNYETFLIYLDNILIFSQDFDTHFMNLGRVFTFLSVTFPQGCQIPAEGIFGDLD